MGEVIPFPGRNALALPVTTHRPYAAEPLWRIAVGDVLREARHRRDQTLADVAARAGISVQYLSEVERGRKEPSSEILAAVAGALGLTLADVTGSVTRTLTAVRASESPRRVPASTPAGPVALAV